MKTKQALQCFWKP